MSEPNAIDARMAAFNKRAGQTFTAEEQEKINRLAKQYNAIDFAENYHQTDASRLIQDSPYGYALFAELKSRHQAEVQTLAAYGQDRIKARTKLSRESQYDPNDPFSAPAEMLILASDPSYLHPLDASYSVTIAVAESNSCDIGITEQCADNADDELFMKHGQVLGFWHGCHRCLTWLEAMARVDLDSDADESRKAKHRREVLYSYGQAARDLTPYMRRGV